MFDVKEYHKKYMRKYRENVIKKSPEKLERIRELDRLHDAKENKNPEILARKRKYKRELIKEKRKDISFKQIELEQRRRYYKTKKGAEIITNIVRKYEKRNPERIKAWAAVHYAIKVGKIKAQPCIVCGKIDGVHAHHPDYKKQLEVIFLCPYHHRQEEMKLIKQTQ